MGKFKPGDKVRIVKCAGDFNNECVGKAFIIDRIDDDGDYRPREGNRSVCRHFSDDELELCQPAIKSRQTSTFFDDEWNRYHDEILSSNPSDMWGRWTPTNNNNLGETIMEKLRTIPKRLKKVLDKDYKAMYQLNWLNGDLERTSKGTEELMDFLIDKYKDDLGALARERVAELEKDNE